MSLNIMTNLYSFSTILLGLVFSSLVYTASIWAQEGIGGSQDSQRESLDSEAAAERLEQLRKLREVNKGSESEKEEPQENVGRPGVPSERGGFGSERESSANRNSNPGQRQNSFSRSGISRNSKGTRSSAGGTTPKTGVNKAFENKDSKIKFHLVRDRHKRDQD